MPPTEVVSRYGTKTPKHFRGMVMPEATTTRPTGVINFKRVELRTILPELGSIHLDVYYKLRIACCGYLMVEGEDKLQDCNVCHDNHGYVCPACMGHTWLTTDYFPSSTRCLRCCYEFTGEKGKIQSLYDPDRELQTVRRWLTRRFPYGIPSEPTQADLERMDRY